MDTHGIPPTYPFHVARAYGPAPRAMPGSNLDSAQHVQPRAQAIDTLVAGKVSVTPNFNAVKSAPNSDALPLYRHPADKNAAATGVSLGQSLDLNA